MSPQLDWLEHAKRHMERAEHHRSQGDYEYARTELVSAISDIWVAAREVDEERENPHPVHLAPPHGEFFLPCCEGLVVRQGPWSTLSRITLDPDKVTCKGEKEAWRA